MAVIPGSVKEHRDGSQGVHNWTAGPTYTAHWRLETDDEQDQSQTVLNWFRANVVELGTFYTFAGDAAGSTARAQNISARQIDGSCTHWQVSVQYANESQENARQETEVEGVYSDNPLDWAPTLEVQTIHHQGPVVSATYRGGYGVDFETHYPLGKAGLHPMNSAFSPYRNPPLTEDRSRIAAILGHNYAKWTNVNDVKAYENTVNTDTFYISYRGQTIGFSPREAKIREITFDYRTWKGVGYLNLGWMIEQAPTFVGGTGRVRDWRHYLLDEGTEVLDESATTEYKLKVPVDDDGNVIAGPFGMDGNGQKLPVGDDYVYAVWQSYEETAFLSIPILGSLLSPNPPP